MKFYDRKHEIKYLRKKQKISEKSSLFTMVSGRRRVGKTALLLRAFRGQPFLYLFTARKEESILCAEFQEEAKAALGPFGWDETEPVHSFGIFFKKLMLFAKMQSFTLVIDEFQDMEKVNPSIFSDIQHYWDLHKDQAKINLIVCGSFYSLMIKLFQGYHEPLFGRLDARLLVRPFTTEVIKQILADYNPSYTKDDLLCFYMLTGGTAKYIDILIQHHAWTKEKMINYALSSDSFFIFEGKNLLMSEFGRDYDMYFTILMLIGNGMTRQAEIDSVIGKNTASYLANLERDYSIIKRSRPLFSKPGSHNVKWQIGDNYLRFYFRYIFKYQTLIESSNFEALRKIVKDDYTSYSGLILENYFYDKIAHGDEKNWTEIGRYWDRKGKTEIDLISYHEQNHNAAIYEIKRQKSKIDMHILAEKAETIKKELPGYTFSLKEMSIEDM
jgi:AAA+ ATPase superfamily predicted ATPase